MAESPAGKPLSNPAPTLAPKSTPVNAGLRFKPITSGLGFHPFSEGLPYTPVSKSASTGMASSTLRAKPQAAPLSPPPTAPLNSARVTAAAARAAGSFGHPGPFPHRPAQLQPSSTPATATAAVAITLPSANAIESGDFGFAYSLKRVLAFLLDLGLVGGLCIAAFGWTLWRQKIPAESLLSPEMALLFFSFLAVFSWSMIVAQEMAFGTTVGKRLFGLILIGSPAAIFLRAFFFLPSVGFCGIGLLWAAFDSQRRCWHDLASEVQPTEVAEL